MYSHLLTCFPGWTWEYIDDHMTIPRYLTTMKYQKENPPLHIMVAAYLGVGKEPVSKKTGLDESGQSLLDVCPQGG